METLDAMPEFTRTFDGVDLEFHRAAVMVESVLFLGFVSRRGQLHRTARLNGTAFIGLQVLTFKDQIVAGCVVDELMRCATGGNTLSCCIAIDLRNETIKLVGAALYEHRHQRKRWELTF